MFMKILIHFYSIKNMFVFDVGFKVRFKQTLYRESKHNKRKKAKGYTSRQDKEIRSKRKFEKTSAYKVSELAETENNDKQKEKRQKVETEYGIGLRRLKELIYEIMGFEPSGEYETIKMKKRPPFIVNVKSKDLLNVESFESNSGGFRKRQSDLRDEDYVSDHDMDMDELVKDFVDEEDEKNEDVEEGNEHADAYKMLFQAQNEKIVDTSGTSSS
ncbi:hypothetical protein L1887_14134 [Cichorium endivia]|nr:hypothetical protein L1887_14134 [Cichorium endivia]